MRTSSTRRKPTTGTARPVASLADRIAVAKRTEHIFRDYDRLLDFANATAADLERWPHRLMYAIEIPVGCPEGLDLKELSHPLSPDDLRDEAENTACWLFHPWEGPADDAPHVHPGCPDRGAHVELAKRIHRDLNAIVSWMLALDPERSRWGAFDPDLFWHWYSCRYIAAVQRELGWGGGNRPRSRNRRDLRGTSTEPFHVREAKPRACVACGHFFHALRNTARRCPDCRNAPR